MSAKKLYDWATWLAALPITLRQGEHYSCSQAAMCQQVRNAASAAGILVAVEDRGDRVVVRRKPVAARQEA